MLCEHGRSSEHVDRFSALRLSISGVMHNRSPWQFADPLKTVPRSPVRARPISMIHIVPWMVRRDSKLLPLRLDRGEGRGEVSKVWSDEWSITSITGEALTEAPLQRRTRKGWNTHACLASPAEAPFGAKSL
jgi:hypothetical protein